MSNKKGECRDTWQRGLGGPNRVAESDTFRMVWEGGVLGVRECSWRWKKRGDEREGS